MKKRFSLLVVLLFGLFVHGSELNGPATQKTREIISYVYNLKSSNSLAGKAHHTFWPQIGIELSEDFSEVTKIPEESVRKRSSDGISLTKVKINAQVSQALLDEIKKEGEVIWSSSKHGVIIAEIPFTSISSLIQRSDVSYVGQPDQATTNKINVVESVFSQDVIKTVSKYPLASGQGIKIGVLSDSVDYLLTSQLSGDLPFVQVLPGQAGQGSGEGTAMLEIIHDMAPNAQLAFATAFTSLESFAENIVLLADAGCQVIVDDVFYFAESPFNDDPIAQSVNEVAKRGVAYFSSAGNSGNTFQHTSSVWEGDYKPSASFLVNDYLDVHEFPDGNSFNSVYGRIDPITLHWVDDPSNRMTDYDIFVFNSDGKLISIGASVLPYEFVPVIGSEAHILVARYEGPPRPISLRANRGKIEMGTNGQISGHSGAEGAFSVAAIPSTLRESFADLHSQGVFLETEYFTSQGPRKYFFENNTAITNDFTWAGGKIRPKPEITAADGLTTSVEGFEIFFGTSAAAPTAAAIAALALSVYPSLTLAQLREAMFSTAIDILSPGYDDVSGHGIINLEGILDYILSDDCASSPCGTGTCIDGFRSHRCYCLWGESTENCEVANPCESSPCLHNGICNPQGFPESFICTCLPPYVGQTCDIEVFTASLQPNPGENGAVALGRSVISGLWVVAPGVFSDGIKNAEIRLVSDSSIIFSFNTFDGALEPAEDLPADLFDRNVLLQGGYKVIIKTGTFLVQEFTGIFELWDNDGCNLKCANGNCRNFLYVNFCECNIGYEGDLCEIQSFCHSNPCKNGGKCHHNPLSYCECPPGYFGPTCNEGHSDCALNPCSNGGICFGKDLDGSIKCACQPGFYGPLCKNKIEYCTSNICQNGGSCFETSPPTCLCPQGYFGPICESQGCHECKNGGVCQDNGSTKSCSCPIGYSGATCEKGFFEFECNQLPCGFKNVNMTSDNEITVMINFKGIGSLSPNSRLALQTFYESNNPRGTRISLTSPQGTKAFLTRQRGVRLLNIFNGVWWSDGARFSAEETDFSPAPSIISPEDPFSAFDLGNMDGIWTLKIEILNRGAINYLRGITFDYDDQDYCQSSVCPMHSTCQSTYDQYSCKCNEGYYGENCDMQIDPCEINPCGPGICKPEGINFVCDCTFTDFTGPLCSISVASYRCTGFPCLSPYLAVSSPKGVEIRFNVTSAPSMIREDDRIFMYTEIEHTWVSDMIILLYSPSGKSVFVSINNGFDYDHLFNGTWWYDGAPNVAQFPFSGDGKVSPLGPQRPFSIFAGEDPNGVWRFLILDVYSGDDINLLTLNLDIKKDLCKPNPCFNGGICFSDPWKFSCLCDGTGFTGVTCNQVVQCPSVVFGNATWPLSRARQTVRGSCLPGFVGNPVRRCGLNGIFEAPSSNCIPATTRCPPETFARAMWSSTLVGSLAIGTCIPGWIGTPFRRCETTGIWSTYLSSHCQRRKCPTQIAESASWPETTSFSTAQGSCVTGFSGMVSRTCGADGNWGMITGKCLPSSCPAQPEFARAFWPETPSGGTAAGICKAGWAGSPRRMCIDGKWQSLVQNHCQRT